MRAEFNLLDEKAVFNLIKASSFDVVLHTATQNATVNSKEPLNKVLDSNLRMYFNIARCNEYFGKMIYFGSGAEFDRRDYKPFMKEGYFDHSVPMDNYGFSKYVMNKYSLFLKT